MPIPESTARTRPRSGTGRGRTDARPAHDGRHLTVRVLVLNPGSSTLKAAVIEPPGREPLARSIVDWGADATRGSDRVSAVTNVLAAAESERVGAALLEQLAPRDGSSFGARVASLVAEPP